MANTPQIIYTPITPIAGSYADTTTANTWTLAQTFSADPIIPDEVYGSGWNGVLEPPTKNAVYDKIESLSLASGTYTPTLTGVTNVSSSTARLATYMRVGNTVTVAGQIDVTPTANNTQTIIGISLPIASNFSTAYQAGGSGHTIANTVAGHGASIQADATNDRVELDYYETHGATDTITYQFTYQII